jgi:sugar phosphate isomerase/epimerase
MVFTGLGHSDFKRIVSILRKTGYQGDLCVEDESRGKYPANEQADVLRKEIAMLKG